MSEHKPLPFAVLVQNLSHGFDDLCEYRSDVFVRSVFHVVSDNGIQPLRHFAVAELVSKSRDELRKDRNVVSLRRQAGRRTLGVVRIRPFRLAVQIPHFVP